MKEEKFVEFIKFKGEFDEFIGKVDVFKGEVVFLIDQLMFYLCWDKGVFGILGMNFFNFNDWFLCDQLNILVVNIGFLSIVFVNGDFEKFFWCNNFIFILGWLKFDDKDNFDDVDDFQVLVDVFNVIFLFGYKLFDKLVIFILGEYCIFILEDCFNNFGYFDFGVGVIWILVKDLVVVVYFLNYNFVFFDMDFEFEFLLGVKIVVDYICVIIKGINWKFNFFVFMSYEGSDLFNWIWVNGIFIVVKGIGIGLDVGLCSNQ